MFSCEFSKILKNTFFTEHLRTTASACSFSEAAIRGVLWKKVFLKILQNSQENTCGLRNFQEHLFNRAPLDDWLCRTVGARAAKGGLAPQLFDYWCFFIINDSKKKFERCKVLKTGIYYRLRKNTFNKTNSISYN